MKNIFLVDLSKESPENKFISKKLIDTIKNNLSKWKKIILYLNRRWEYSCKICQDCKHIFWCPKCSVSLNSHADWYMVCHSCGYKEKEINACTNCWSVDLKKVWIWTQQVEKSIKNLFKNHKVFRFDSDSIKTQKEKREALKKLDEADIIIWTKMITTWFDLEKVWCIWIILLEQEMSIPEYNTWENVYNNIKQVIWRWWRKGEESDIIIQTFIPENPLIKLIIDWNYKDFLKFTLEERKKYNYPPFCEMVEIIYRDLDEIKWVQKIEKIYAKFKKIFDNLDEKSEQDEINLITNYRKKSNYFISKIIVRKNSLKAFISEIKTDIIKNKNINIQYK